MSRLLQKVAFFLTLLNFAALVFGATGRLDYFIPVTRGRYTQINPPSKQCIKLEYGGAVTIYDYTNDKATLYSDDACKKKIGSATPTNYEWDATGSEIALSIKFH